MWDNKNGNGKTQETASVKRPSKHVPEDPKSQDPSTYVLVIGQQSAHSLQHLEMLAALYGWDLLVMGERGHLVVTSEMTMRQSTSDLLKILEGR